MNIYDINDSLTLEASVLFESAMKDIVLSGISDDYYTESGNNFLTKAKEKVLLALKKVQQKIRKVITSEVNKKYDAEYKKLISKNPDLKNLEIAYDPTADAEVEIGEEALDALKKCKSIEEAEKIQTRYNKLTSEIKKDRRKAFNIARAKTRLKIVGAAAGMVTVLALPVAIYNNKTLRECEKKIDKYYNDVDTFGNIADIAAKRSEDYHKRSDMDDLLSKSNEVALRSLDKAHEYSDLKRQVIQSKYNKGIYGIYTNILYKTSTAVSKVVDNTMKAKKQIISQGNSSQGPLRTLD